MTHNSILSLHRDDKFLPHLFARPAGDGDRAWAAVEILPDFKVISTEPEHFELIAEAFAEAARRLKAARLALVETVAG